MAQAKINNHTACASQVLFSYDENFRPIVVAIVKASFAISPLGQLKFAETQEPINIEGTFVGDPENSSYIYEPEVAFIKPATDVVVIGDAIAEQGPVTELLVSMQVGKLAKTIAVFGDRFWLKQAVGYRMSEPQAFERIPLSYENAFGGWDRRHPDAKYHQFEARNTVGKGFYNIELEHYDVPMPLPNLEDPHQLISSIKDRPAPAACGFTLPHWLPRASLAGTYSDEWQSTRSPLLPEDFDRAYFNAASQGLLAHDGLQGNETVALKNMSASGSLTFSLPGVRAPIVDLELRESRAQHSTVLDTVIINVRKMQCQLIWRKMLPLTVGPHDVEAVDIRYG